MLMSPIPLGLNLHTVNLDFKRKSSLSGTVRVNQSVVEEPKLVKNLNSQFFGLK